MLLVAAPAPVVVTALRPPRSRAQIHPQRPVLDRVQKRSCRRPSRCGPQPRPRSGIITVLQASCSLTFTSQLLANIIPGRGLRGPAGAPRKCARPRFRSTCCSKCVGRDLALMAVCESEPGTLSITIKYGSSNTVARPACDAPRSAPWSC